MLVLAYGDAIQTTSPPPWEDVAVAADPYLVPWTELTTEAVMFGCSSDRVVLAADCSLLPRQQWYWFVVSTRHSRGLVEDLAYLVDGLEMMEDSDSPTDDLLMACCEVVARDHDAAK